MSYSQYDNLYKIPADQMALLTELDPNIPTLVAMIEALRRDTPQYFYFRNLFAAYARLLAKERLRHELQDLK